MDSHLILTSVAVDLICELLAGIGSNNALQQQTVVRWIKLLFGSVTESILQVIIYIFLICFTITKNYFYVQLRIVFNSQAVTLRISDQLSNISLHTVQTKFSEEPLTLKERLLQELLIKIPNDIKLTFGEDDTLNILKYLLDSYEIKKINIDLNLQILDVLASQLLSSCRSNHSKISL